MKKIISITFTLLLAFIFTYAGSGINAYTFCCDDCHTEGVEAIVEDKCCDVHHHEAIVETENSMDAFCEGSHDQCSLERGSLNLQEISTENEHVNLTAHSADFAFITLLYNLTFNTELAAITDYISETQKPPNLSKLDYFSLLETLII